MTIRCASAQLLLAADEKPVPRSPQTSHRQGRAHPSHCRRCPNSETQSRSPWPLRARRTRTSSDMSILPVAGNHIVSTISEAWEGFSENSWARVFFLFKVAFAGTTNRSWAILRLRLEPGANVVKFAARAETKSGSVSIPGSNVVKSPAGRDTLSSTISARSQTVITGKFKPNTEGDTCLTSVSAPTGKD